MEEFIITLGGPDSSNEDDSVDNDYTGDCSSEEDFEDDENDKRLRHREEQLLRELEQKERQ